MPTKLPSRADHVGSFLRPRSVIEAREHRSAGNIDYSELRAIEDKAIAELVKWEESLGLKAITDGEFRRYFFHTDFLLQLDGVEERYFMYMEDVDLCWRVRQGGGEVLANSH